MCESNVFLCVLIRKLKICRPANKRHKRKKNKKKNAHTQISHFSQQSHNGRPQLSNTFFRMLRFQSTAIESKITTQKTIILSDSNNFLYCVYLMCSCRFCRATHSLSILLRSIGLNPLQSRHFFYVNISGIIALSERKEEKDTHTHKHRVWKKKSTKIKMAAEFGLVHVRICYDMREHVSQSSAYKSNILFYMCVRVYVCESIQFNVFV